MNVYRVYVKPNNQDVNYGQTVQDYYVQAENSRDAVRKVLDHCVASFGAIMVDELDDAFILQ